MLQAGIATPRALLVMDLRHGVHDRDYLTTDEMRSKTRQIRDVLEPE